MAPARWDAAWTHCGGAAASCPASARTPPNIAPHLALAVCLRFCGLSCVYCAHGAALFGGPRSVVAVHPALADATAARPSIWLWRQAESGKQQSFVLDREPFFTQEKCYETHRMHGNVAGSAGTGSWLP